MDVISFDVFREVSDEMVILDRLKSSSIYQHGLDYFTRLCYCGMVKLLQSWLHGLQEGESGEFRSAITGFWSTGCSGIDRIPHQERFSSWK